MTFGHFTCDFGLQLFQKTFKKRTPLKREKKARKLAKFTRKYEAVYSRINF